MNVRKLTEEFSELNVQVGKRRPREDEDSRKKTSRTALSALDKLKLAVIDAKTVIMLPCECITDESILQDTNPRTCPECCSMLDTAKLADATVRYLRDPHGEPVYDDEGFPGIIRDDIPKTVVNGALQDLINIIGSDQPEDEIIKSLKEELPGLNQSVVALPCGHVFNPVIHEYVSAITCKVPFPSAHEILCLKPGCEIPMKILKEDPTLKNICDIIKEYDLEQEGITEKDLRVFHESLRPLVKDHIENVLTLKRSKVLEHLKDDPNESIDMLQIQKMLLTEKRPVGLANILELNKEHRITLQDLGRLSPRVQEGAICLYPSHLVAIRQAGLWNKFVNLKNQVSEERYPEIFSGLEQYKALKDPAAFIGSIPGEVGASTIGGLFEKPQV